MGSGASKSINVTETELTENSISEPVKVEWRLLPNNVEARKKFEADGTLKKNSEPGHLELRTMLDEPFTQNALGKYATDIVKASDIFMCWVDVQEYKSIPTDNYRRSKALHIYHKYIKPNAILEVGDIELAEREKYRNAIELSRDDPTILQINFYDRIQMKCFVQMYHNIYIPFKSTPEFKELTQKIKQRYNNVKLTDFEYYHKLGEGGFGFVVHCKKISTGKHYAMKLQTKKGLLECFQDDPWRADFEKQAFASCQHPFIVNLDYAFQTNSLAIMVLGLSTAGDLQKALNKAPEEKLSEARVRFYVAEIVLALSYLHQLGLMYRDLKPNNVLLNEDGHIQLVDLGGVADEYGTTLGKHNEVHGLIPLFTQSFQAMKKPVDPATKTITEPEDDGKKKPKRKLSIMGTFGYMAPEMVIMLNQASYEKTGYTYTVDWWSLGVTMFKLLTGYRPFTDDNFNTFVEMATTMNELVREHCDLPEFAILFQEIPFPSFLSPEAVGLMSKLLDVNDKTRLGSGENGVKNIKSHVFFKGIDWDLLEQKHVEPPYKPPHSKLFDELVPYPDCETMLKSFGKGDWVEEEIAPSDQEYFKNWDFTSPHTIRVESGLAHTMDQYDKNFKVRQLMGEGNKQMTGTSSANTTTNSTVTGSFSRQLSKKN